MTPTPVSDGSGLVSQLFVNAGYCRLWKVVATIFLAAGVLGLLVRTWEISADLQARRTWPSAQGEIVAAEQRDDTNLSFRRSIRGHTRYWLEYEVEFAVPENQCRTGAIYIEPNGTISCHGIIRTRSTQSTREVYGWLIHGYARNQPVKILYNPSGPEVKIAGESIWLRFNFEWLIGNVLWVIVFFPLYVFARGRLEYFKSHPEAERVPSPPDSADKYKLTSLDLS